MSGKKEKRLLNKANIYNKEILVNFPHLKRTTVISSAMSNVNTVSCVQHHASVKKNKFHTLKQPFGLPLDYNWITVYL